jgi:hypothetical protein
VPSPAEFANMGGGDDGNAYLERGEIHDLSRPTNQRNKRL